MIGRVNTGGGGNGGTLTVTAPAGVTVTVSKDGKTKTKVAGSDGIVVFKGLASGSWTVTITDGSQTAQKVAAINTDYALVISFNTIPEFTYTGDYEIVNDSDKPITTSQADWKIRFLTSGTLTFTELKGAENGIDVFLVGGGAGGSSEVGGGGGYTATKKKILVGENVPYTVVVGSGGAPSSKGGDSSAFSVSAGGGAGMNGGSGGGAYDYEGPSGGSDGSDGQSGVNSTPGGTGQHTTTREFGEAGARLYAGGGGGRGATGRQGPGGAGGGGTGANQLNGATDGDVNTGGGAGGGGVKDYEPPYKSGGSGIVIIRNAREVA